MKYRVVGCDKNGAGVDIIIEAPDLAWAQRMARQRGIKADSVDAVAAPKAAPAAQLSKPTAAAPAKTPKLAGPAARPAATRPAQAGVSAPKPPPPPPQDEVIDLPASAEEQVMDLPVSAEVVELSADAEVDPLEALEPALAPAAVQGYALPSPPPSPPPAYAPPAAYQAPRRRAVNVNASSFRLPLMGAGALVAIAAVVWIIWTYALPALGLAGGFDTYSAYLPSDAKLVGYANVAGFRDTEAYRDMKASMGMNPMMRSTGLGDMNRFVDEVDSITFGDAGSRHVAVVRFRKPMTASDLGGVAQSFDGQEGARIGGECAARIDDRTWCIASDAGELRAALSRGKGGGKLDLADGMSSMMSEVRGEDIYVVSKGGSGGLGMPAQSFGFGVSLGSSISLRAVVEFGSEREAESVVTEFEEMRKSAREEKNAAAEKALKLLDNVKMSNSGSTLKVRFSGKYADIKSLSSGGRGPGFNLPGMGR